MEVHSLRELLHEVTEGSVSKDRSNNQFQRLIGPVLSDSTTMLHYGLVFLALLSISLAQPAIPVEPMILARSCPYPNGTATAIHTYNCDASHKITVKSVKVLNANGQPMYPIQMKKPIVLLLEAENDGDVYYAQKVDVVLRKYHSGWFSSVCSWNTIPTFGLLNNIDGCKYAHNCPVQKGKLEIRVPLDLSAFSSIISMMAGNSAYELEIRFHNYNSVNNNHEEIACVVSQMRIA